MSRPVKYIAIALTVVLVGAVVFGIAVWSASYDPDNPDPGFYLNGKRVDEPGVALAIGENEISFNDYRHYYLVTKGSLESYYGNTMWNDDPDGDLSLMLRDAVELDLASQYAWLQIAADNGIALTDEELAGINDTLAEQKKTFGDAFEQQLAEMYFSSEEDYLRITEMQTLSSKVQTEYRQMVSDELSAAVGAQADAEYGDKFLTAKHILIAFDEAEVDTVKAEADALAEAEDLMRQIRDSEDPAATFEELMWEYTDDMDGLEGSPDGYTFTEGDMVDEFYQTAKETAEGEISDPVKSTYGYHIIMRLPLSDAEKESSRESAISAAASEKVQLTLDEVKATMPVTGGSYYDDIHPDSIV